MGTNMKKPSFLKLFLILWVYIPLLCAEINSTFIEKNSTFVFIPDAAVKHSRLSLSGGRNTDDGKYGCFGGNSPIHNLIVQVMDGKEKEKLKQSDTDGLNQEEENDTEKLRDDSDSDSDTSSPVSDFDQEPFPDIGEISLENVDDILQQIETMLIALPEGEEAVLISDLDDTLIPSYCLNKSKQERLIGKFTAFVERMRQQKKFRLIIVTLKGWAHKKGYFQERNLAEPDYLISGCYEGGPVVVRAGYSDTFLSEVMPATFCHDRIHLQERGFSLVDHNDSRFKMNNNVDQIKELLESQALRDNIPIISVKAAYNFTYLFTVNTNLFDPTDAVNLHKISDLVFNTFGVLARFDKTDMPDQFFLSFPKNKGAFVSRFSSAMKLEGAHILVSGDSDPDLSMMTSHEGSLDYQVTESVLVGGPEGLDEEIVKSRNIRRSKSKYIAGIIEGLYRMLKKLKPSGGVSET